MTVLDQDSLEVSSTMPDAFGTSSPTTEVGLENRLVKADSSYLYELVV